VERVWNVLPQAHFTVAVAYSGWMSAFISSLASRGASVEGRVHVDVVDPVMELAL
jgi:hypothetical protein